MLRGSISGASSSVPARGMGCRSAATKPRSFRLRAKTWTAYHRVWYVAPNMTIAAVGPFPGGCMRRLVVQAFSGMRVGPAYQWARDSEERASTSRVLIVDNPSLTQTHFVIGVPGIHRTDADRLPLWIANNIIGGKFTSLLNEQLRNQSGLTYGADSYFDEDRLSGLIGIESYSDNSATETAVDLALDVLRNIREHGVTTRQVRAAKLYIKGHFPPENFQTTAQLARLLTSLELYQLTRADVDTLFSRIDRVSTADVNRVIQRYFSMSRAQFVFAGPGARIRKFANKYAPLQFQLSMSNPGFEIPEPELDGHEQAGADTP